MDQKPRKLMAPFEPTNFSFVTPSNEALISKLSDFTPESFLVASPLDLQNDLDDLLMRTQEQFQVLNERALRLKNMLNKDFGISDPEMWLTEQSETKPKESKPITLTM